MTDRIKDVGALRVLAGLLGIWWVFNLLQAGLTELANDEAYYYIFSLQPAWGYFDHPPITAWLVWLGTHIFGDGAFGVRFFFVLLQPVYLWIFYLVVRPKGGGTGADALLYVTLCAALPILQLYGFVAVPDGPLLFSAAIFLLCYKRFIERGRIGDAMAMGASIALMAYCKYHGALVLVFALASKPKLFLNWRLYLAGAVAGVLILPHLIWQYDHDWVSMGYHLSGRNKVFRPDYITDYLLNLLAVFNPLFWPTYVRAWVTTRTENDTQRAVRMIGAGLIIFFLISSIRGYVQPQWTIIAAFMFVMLLFNYARQHRRTRRYLTVAGGVTICLMLLTRIVMIFNPWGLIKFEVFDNKPTYAAIAAEAAGRPVIFGGNYAIAAKYNYYTGGESYCQPNLYYRSSQWELMDNDTHMAGRQVLVEVDASIADTTLHLSNSKMFSYTVLHDFRPVRLVKIVLDAALPASVRRGERLNVGLTITNPYDYPIAITPDSISMSIVWGRQKQRDFHEFTLPMQCVVPSGESVHTSVPVDVVQDLVDGDYRVGFALRCPPLAHWYNSPLGHVKVEI